MSKAPIVHVIHRDKDEERLRFVQNRYESANLRYELISAIDGHQLENLRSHRNLLGLQFWDKTQIKPGAFGCFLSHRKAWQKLVESDEPYMIIAEDDTKPIGHFRTHWPKYEAHLEKVDCLFLNDRTSSWTSRNFENLNATILADRESRLISKSERAPGADGYALTRNFALELLRLSEKHGVICGVDWFMIGALWKMRENYYPDQEEFAFIHKYLGNEPKNCQGKFSGKPLFKMKGGMPSAISHNHKIKIQELREKLTD